MTQKVITLNIGMNDLPNDMTFSQIMDGLAYTFDTAEFDWGAVGSYWEGEPERTIVVRFKIARIPDSTILQKLEAACSVLNQDAIAFVISSLAKSPYLTGLAYAPSVDPNYRLLFDAKYFKGIGALASAEDSTGVLKYTSTNQPLGSRHKVQATKLVAVRAEGFDRDGEYRPIAVCHDIHDMHGNFLESRTDFSYFETEDDAQQYIDNFNS